MDLPQIIVFGSLNADLTTVTPRIPDGGETISANSFTTSAGGKGFNQAVACHRLSRSKVKDGLNFSKPSARVTLTGAIGMGTDVTNMTSSEPTPDANGAMIFEEALATGLDVSGVHICQGVPTGVAVVIVEQETGENRILITAGANGEVDPIMLGQAEDPVSGAWKNTPDLIVMQLEIPLATVRSVLAEARERGVPVLLNAAPATTKLSKQELNGLEHLIVNETEAATMTGIDVTEDDTWLDQAFKEFDKLGIKRVVITLGANGSAYRTFNGSSGRVQAAKVKRVVDTTSAGDTFVGAYAVHVVTRGEDFDIEAAVQRASHAAAKTVERQGSSGSIPWIDELR